MAPSMAFGMAAPMVGGHLADRALAITSRRSTLRAPAAGLPATRRARMAPVMGIAIVYASTTGNCADVAEMIAKDLGGTVVDAVVEIGDTTPADLAEYDGLVVGAPTWNTGADTERSGTDWDTFLYEELDKVSFDGKPVAVFGTGDSVSYGDYFADAIAELHERFAARGAKMVGAVPVDGYQHTESKAQVGEVFVGLPLDQDNEDDLTPARVKAWCDQLKAEAGWA